MNLSETGSSSNMSSQIFDDSAVVTNPPPSQRQDEIDFTKKTQQDLDESRVTETEVKKLIPENPDASAKLADFFGQSEKR